MKIGVFDSGIGGEAVAHELRSLIEYAEVVSVNDHKNVPYGGRPKDEIIELTDAAIQPLLKQGCDAIVLACNTATTNAISALRERYPTQKFVGLEPMVKPAARTSKTKKIAVLATPATLQSQRYAELKKQWAENVTVFEPDCHTWATLIENNKINDVDLEAVITPLLEADVDVIVLGCTHYHWLKNTIQKKVGSDITVLEPSNAISSRILSIVG
ncbi:MAG: glutamate racemase [Candidatus Microsaccharimonas sp.]